MCGIVGVVLKNRSGFYKQTEDAFFQLLEVDALRGRDSTGMVLVEKNTTFHIKKEATEPAWFIPQVVADPIVKKMFNEGVAYIGHNRKKTMGEIKDSTAHPFVVDEQFALVHNGTLYQHEKLANTEVDSEALAITLAKAFEEEDYKSALETTLPTINGAYAVALYDQRHNVVRLLRNKERPLAIVETNNAWFFASEAAMLFWVLARNGYTGKDLEIKTVPTDTVVTFDLEPYITTCKEESLELKKPYTTPTILSGVTSTTVKSFFKKGPAPTEGGLSKNEFKRLRRKLLGTRVEWWCDDYVETFYPKTIAQGETAVTLMGDCSDIIYDNIVRTEIDLKELCLTEEALTNSLWTGRVEELSYDTISKKVTVVLVKASPLPFSFTPKKETLRLVGKKSEIINDVWIKERLDANEKASQSSLH